MEKEVIEFSTLVGLSNKNKFYDYSINILNGYGTGIRIFDHGNKWLCHRNPLAPIHCCKGMVTINQNWDFDGFYQGPGPILSGDVLSGTPSCPQGHKNGKQQRWT